MKAAGEVSSTERAGSIRRADRMCLAAFGSLGGIYVLLIVALLAADLIYATPAELLTALRKPEIMAAIRLTVLSCTFSALLAVWVSVPLGYVLSRCRFPGRAVVDVIVDLPLVLPPLVLGLSLLILFHLPFSGTHLEAWLRGKLNLPVTYHVPAVILAQFTACTALAVRTMRLTFDRIPVRHEHIAATLGATRWQAISRVTLPQSLPGIATAFALAWARSLGEFGPILVFAGATRMKTEVLSTSVYLEMSMGNLQAAVAVSLLMVLVALGVLLLIRRWGGAPPG